MEKRPQYRLLSRLISLCRLKSARRALASLRGIARIETWCGPNAIHEALVEVSDIRLHLSQTVALTYARYWDANTTELFARRELLLRVYARHGIISGIVPEIGRGRFAAPAVPDEWIGAFVARRIPVSRSLVRIEVRRTCRHALVRAAIAFVRLTIGFRLLKRAPSHYAAFAGLTKSVCSNTNDSPDRQTVERWYRSYPRRRYDTIVQELAERSDRRISDRLVRSRSLIPAGLSIDARLIFVADALWLLACSFWRIHRMGVFALLLPRAVECAYTKRLDPGSFAREYWFTNSSWFYRPPWTSIAEKRGSNVNLLFYSTISEQYTYGRRQTVAPMYGLPLMKWSLALVWNEYERRFLYTRTSLTNIDVVPAIPFADSGVTFSFPVGRPVLAVFDVSPARMLALARVGIGPGYADEAVVLAFLQDVIQYARKTGFDVVWKAKRRIAANRLSKSFRRRRHLLLKETVTQVDPNVSAHRVIKRATATISIPFTSTAVIGKSLGVPSAYYDCTGTIITDHSHGVTFLQTKADLQKWLTEVHHRTLSLRRSS